MKRVIMIFVAVLVVTCLVHDVIGSEGSESNKSIISDIKRHISLYDKYVAEGDYERASQAYNKAVELGGRELFAEHLQVEHKRSIKAIDDAWAKIHEGNEYTKRGMHEEAAVAFRQAYDAKGERGMSGMYLAETYEKLNKHDEAIQIIDEMIEKVYLSKMGIAEARELRTRIVAAKNKTRIAKSNASSP